jgi:hypothetical protein
MAEHGRAIGRFKLLLWSGVALAVLGGYVAFTLPGSESFALLRRLGFLTTAIGCASVGGALVRYREAIAAVDGHPRSLYGSSPTTTLLTSVPVFWTALAFAVRAFA